MRWLLVLVAALLVVGCGPSPKTVASTYLDALMHSDQATIYKCLSSSDRELAGAESLGHTAFPGTSVAGGTSSADMLLKRVSYKVTQVDVAGPRAVVGLEVSAPDISSLMGDLLSASLRAAFGGKRDQVDLDSILKQKLSDGDLPVTVSNAEVNLIREAGRWKVLLGLAARRKADSLRSVARRSETTRQWEQARTSYGEAIRLLEDARVAAQREALDSLKQDDERVARLQSYVDSLVVSSVSVRRSEWMADGFISGFIKNTGSRTLDYLELRVYLLDRDGGAVGEESTHPVLARDNEAPSNDWEYPLKPNYSRRFLAVVDHAPPDWAWKVSAEVSDLSYLER